MLCWRSFCGWNNCGWEIKPVGILFTKQQFIGRPVLFLYFFKFMRKNTSSSRKVRTFLPIAKQPVLTPLWVPKSLFHQPHIQFKLPCAPRAPCQEQYLFFTLLEISWVILATQLICFEGGMIIYHTTSLPCCVEDLFVDWNNWGW